MNASELLADARFHHKRLPALPQDVRPQTCEQAYDCQHGVVERLLEYYGGIAIGYKVACTNEVAQRQLQVTTPFYGRLLSSFCYESGIRLDSGKFSMRVIEAEFAFRMATDLPLSPSAFSKEQVAAAVEGVMPAIEIVDSRFDDWMTVGTPSLIADNACNAGWVSGELISGWKDLDLAAERVRVEVNGETRATGNGAAVLGHPLNALLWLANALNERGASLKAGDLISTGVTTGLYMAEKGDVIRAHFGRVGSVEVAFA